MSKTNNQIKVYCKKMLLIAAQPIVFGLTWYYKILHFLTQRDYSNSKHLEVRFEGLSVQINLLTHEQYVQQRIEALRIFRKEAKSTEEFLLKIFQDCRQCNYVVLESKNNEKKFIQFWLADRKLMADFPIVKGNALGRYRYSMLGVLNELGIHAVLPEMSKPKRIPYYQHKQLPDLETYEIYFQDYPDEAVTFTKILFEDVFKEKFDDIEYELA
ncbi:MAG: hypothetical protein WDZ94_01920 [Patescibacteria group bacterium]